MDEDQIETIELTSPKSLFDQSFDPGGLSEPPVMSKKWQAMKLKVEMEAAEAAAKKAAHPDVVVHPGNPSLKAERCEPLSRDKWDYLGPKQQWDVLTAMRGPDYGGQPTLKWLTAAVLRARMRKILRPEGGSAMYNQSINFIVVPHGGSSVNPYGLFDVHHYIGHQLEAAQFIGVPVLSIEQLVWDRVVASHITQSINVLHQYGAENERDFWRTVRGRL